MEQNINKYSDEKTVDWLFLDLNSYFASVEQQENPDLIGRPVAVVPMETDSTCAIAASYEAKAYGIKTGTKIYEAKQMCPDLVCVLARHHKYVEYHHKIMEEIVRHTPITKVWSIDELSSRLLPNRRSLHEAILLAHRIKRGLRDNIGPAITCSIGLACNGYLGKVASDMQKPDGLVHLCFNDLPGRLLDLELKDFPGIGANMEKRLNRAGLWTVDELWHTHPKQLRRIWGGVEGERFWYRLHGYDIPDLETHTSVIGHSRVLDTELRAPDKALGIARQLTVKACQRLRRKGFYAGSFTLSVKTTDAKAWRREVRLDHANDNIVFIKLLNQLWALMVATLNPYLLKKVSVTLHSLKAHSETTGDLFKQAEDDADIPAYQHSQKTKSIYLTASMDSLNQKFGPNTVHFGVSPTTKAGYVGTKIAFSRIPDMAEFKE